MTFFLAISDTLGHSHRGDVCTADFVVPLKAYKEIEHAHHNNDVRSAHEVNNFYSYG